MTRPILLAASYDKKENLAAAIKKHYNKTRYRNDRRPEVPLWPGEHTFTDFYKATFPINQAPLLAYSAADSLLNTDSDIITVGNKQTHAIIKSMKNYFSLHKRRFEYAPPTNNLRETINAAITQLDIGLNESFVFQATDTPLNNASRYAKLPVSKAYQVVAYWPSKQVIHQNPNNPSAQAINRVYQFPLRINGEEHNCKESNTWILRNHPAVIDNLNHAFNARKGTKTKKGTMIKFLWNTLKAHPTKLPAMTRAVGKALNIYQEARRDGAPPYIPIQEAQAATYEVFDIRAAIRVAPGELGEVFDVDSADDLVLANQIIHTHGHPHADAIESWKQDEFPKLYKQHPQLHPANQAATINNYLTTHGHKPIFTPSATLLNSTQKKQQPQLEF